MWHHEATAGAAHCTHSTGTGGDLTWRHRSHAEVALINQVFAARPAAGPGQLDQGLVLSLRYNRHGMSLPIASTVPVLPAGVSDDVELDQLIEMLGAELSLLGSTRRATTITGQAEDLALVAQAVLERKRARLGGTIERVVLGGRVSPTVSELVARAFPNAAQIERYSLSEVLGGASRTAPDAYLKLDGHVIGEVLDVDGSPTQPGHPGELTLTELFPLVQLQPLIRYRTGDVVEADGAGDLYVDGFRWLGRRDDCLRGPTGWMLRASLLLDWLGQRSSVSRASHRPQLRSVQSADVAEPFVQVRWQRGLTELVVGLRVNPWLDEPGVLRLVSGLWSTLPDVMLAPAKSTPVRIGLLHHPNASEPFEPWANGAVRWLDSGLLSDAAPGFAYS